jgi:serine/threonine protein phosphatase 1
LANAVSLLDLNMKRTLVIGDIHGGLQALLQLFDRASVTQDDELIFLGDYVDGWSESPAVLDFLIGLHRTHNCVCVRGNHDDLLMEWLKGKDNELWYQHGGDSTILAYSKIPTEMKHKHIEFLESLKNYHHDDQNRLFVHAGFTNMHGVSLEHYPRLLFWDRSLWETAVALDKSLDAGDLRYPKRLAIYKEIYIGHTPVTKIGESVPTRMGNVWNIDTGAAFRGKLSMIDIGSKQFWQSDPLPELYPGEIGRNQK